MGKKIKPNSIVVNPTNLLQGSVQDSIEDRSAFLNSDTVVTWTGTELQFADDINIEIVGAASGATSVHTIASSNSPIALNDGESAWVTIDRTQASETLTLNKSDTLAVPAHSNANKDVFILFKRKDSNGVARLYIPLHKQVLNPGQTELLGASGSGGDKDTPHPADGFSELVYDRFEEQPSNDLSTVYDAETNSEHNIANSLYQLSCDKSLSLTTTGTSFSLSALPSFTIAVGDILFDNLSREFRKITALSNQQNGTLDVAFTVDLSANAGMVSQAVWTKDLVRYGDVSQKQRILDAYPTPTISTVNLSYKDSLSSNDNIPDFVDEARIAASVSNVQGVRGDILFHTNYEDGDLIGDISKGNPTPVNSFNAVVSTVDGSERVVLGNTGQGNVTYEAQDNLGDSNIVSFSTWYSYIPGTVPTNEFLFNIIATQSANLSFTKSGSTKFQIQIGYSLGTYNSGDILFPSFVDAQQYYIECYADVTLGVVYFFIDGNLIFSDTFAPGARTPYGIGDTVSMSHNDGTGGSGYGVSRFDDWTFYEGIQFTSSHTAPLKANTELTGVPSIVTYAPIYIRPNLPDQVLNYPLLNNSDKTGLNLLFFCNPDNSSVTANANLLDYEVSLIEDEVLQNGGFLSSAYCRTDNSSPAVNCQAPTVVGGVTEIELDFNYVPGINPGDPRGDLDVIVDGKVIPRQVVGSTSVHWTEVTGSTSKIRLWDDLSAFNLSVEIVRRQGSIDTSDANTLSIATLQQTTEPAQNLLLNGDFEIWQRLISETVTTTRYVADRWRSNANSTASVVFSRQALSGTDVPAQYAMRMRRSAGTDLWDITQGLLSRDFHPLKGKTVTFSVYLRKGTDLTSDINLTVNTTDIQTIAGASIIDTATLNIPNASISNSEFQRFSVSLEIPAGTAAGALRCIVQVESQAGNTNAYLDVAQAMLHEGAQLASFKRAGKSFQDELDMAQAFYEKSYDLATFPGASTTNGLNVGVRGNGSSWVSVSMKTRKHSNSYTANSYSPVDGVLNTVRNLNTGVNNAATAENEGETSFTISVPAASIDDSLSFHWDVDAEL